MQIQCLSHCQEKGNYTDIKFIKRIILLFLETV